MNSLSREALKQLFTEARSFNAWTNEPVTDEQLRAVHELAKFSTTATNAHPTRFFFVRSPEAKQTLKAALNPGNVDKTMAAPVTAVIAWDEKFYEKMPQLFPARPQLAQVLGDLPLEKRDFMMLQNTGLEAAWFMLAARALGLDVGPMGGFDRAKVDETLLAGTGWRSVLLINLGHGQREGLFPRLPRLSFDDAARIA